MVLQWERGADLTILNRGRTTASGPVPEQFMICTSCGMWFEPRAGTGQTQARKKRNDWHDKRCANHDLQYSVLKTERRVDCLQILPDMEDLDIRPDNLQEFASRSGSRAGSVRNIHG